MSLLAVLLTLVFLPASAHAFPISSAAWSSSDWEQHCKDVRTTFNRDRPLATDRLTLTLMDPRLLDFIYWVWANKILEHQVEQVGGTEWEGSRDGVIFHWAPGSRWEAHTIAPFDHAIHHIADEHHWRDNMFKEFFEKFGPVEGVNIKSRLSLDESPTWEQFLEHIGGPESPYYRFVFHQESTIDPQRRVVTMFGGQGVLFDILRAILAGSSGSAHRLQGLPILSVIRFLGTRFCFDDGLGWTVDSEELKAKPVVTPRYPFEWIPQLPSRPASLGPWLFTTWASSSPA